MKAVIRAMSRMVRSSFSDPHCYYCGGSIKENQIGGVYMNNAEERWFCAKADCERKAHAFMMVIKRKAEQRKIGVTHV